MTGSAPSVSTMIFAAGQAGVIDRATDHEDPGGVDQQRLVEAFSSSGSPYLLGEDQQDHVFPEIRTAVVYLRSRHPGRAGLKSGPFGGNRLAIGVTNGDLGLAVAGRRYGGRAVLRTSESRSRQAGGQSGSASASGLPVSLVA